MTPTSAALAPASGRSGWRGHLELTFDAEQGRTILSRRSRSGPLSVQRPFYPEQSGTQVYILHPPGGVVGGDVLEIETEVNAPAEVLVTTPGAAKLYRSEGDSAEIRNDLRVAGRLEWLPQENIFFNGARVRQRTRITLAPGAGFLGWEIHCFGRIAAGETFERGHLDLGTTIVREDYPVFVERLRVNDGGSLASAGLRGFPVCATFYATPVSAELRDSMRDLQCHGAEECCGITLVEDLLIVRYLGANVAAARARLEQVWQRVRPAIIGREAVPPRIWAT